MTERGWRVVGHDGRRIGTVDAVFVDYLLVRTASLLPIDLYIPSDAVTDASDGVVSVDTDPTDARRRWRRPLRKAPHGER